jgi:hypothetical protein
LKQAQSFGYTGGDRETAHDGVAREPRRVAHERSLYRDGTGSGISYRGLRKPIGRLSTSIPRRLVSQACREHAVAQGASNR